MNLAGCLKSTVPAAITASLSDPPAVPARFVAPHPQPVEEGLGPWGAAFLAKQRRRKALGLSESPVIPAIGTVGGHILEQDQKRARQAQEDRIVARLAEELRRR